MVNNDTWSYSFRDGDYDLNPKGWSPTPSSFVAPTTAKNLAQEFVDMNTGRIRRLQGGEESQVQVGEEVEILIDRIQNDAR